MSKDAVAKFVEKLTADKALAAQVEQAVAGKEGRAAGEAFAATAKANGFDFSAEELAAAIVAQKGELTPEQLAQVSGGNNRMFAPHEMREMEGGGPGEPTYPNLPPGWTYASGHSGGGGSGPSR